GVPGHLALVSPGTGDGRLQPDPDRLLGANSPRQKDSQQPGHDPSGSEGSRSTRTHRCTPCCLPRSGPRPDQSGAPDALTSLPCAAICPSPSNKGEFFVSCGITVMSMVSVQPVMLGRWRR